MAFLLHMMLTAPRWALITAMLGVGSLALHWLWPLALFAAGMTAIGILSAFLVILFGPGLPLPTPIARATGRARRP